MLKEEIRIFFTAMMFYSRLPCPSWTDHSEEYLNKATKYFPLVGLIVGFLSGVIGITSGFIFPFSVSVLLLMVASIWITGAFHEDGLADVCDGFGGGWTPERILEIMKDSRVGTYGVAGLGLVLALKFALLFEIGGLLLQDKTIFSLIFMTLIWLSGQTTSRWAAILVIFTHPYARKDATSKVKPVAKKMSLWVLLQATFWTFLPLVGLIYWFSFYTFLLLIPILLFKIYLANFFTRKIGGYTGDCLGATQQLSEIVFYMGIWILLNLPLSF